MVTIDISGANISSDNKHFPGEIFSTYRIENSVIVYFIELGRFCKVYFLLMWVLMSNGKFGKLSHEMAYNKMHQMKVYEYL